MSKNFMRFTDFFRLIFTLFLLALQMIFHMTYGRICVLFNTIQKWYEFGYVHCLVKTLNDIKRKYFIQCAIKIMINFKH